MCTNAHKKKPRTVKTNSKNVDENLEKLMDNSRKIQQNIIKLCNTTGTDTPKFGSYVEDRLQMLSPSNRFDAEFEISQILHKYFKMENE